MHSCEVLNSECSTTILETLEHIVLTLLFGVLDFDVATKAMDVIKGGRAQSPATRVAVLLVDVLVPLQSTRSHAPHLAPRVVAPVAQIKEKRMCEYFLCGSHLQRVKVVQTAQLSPGDTEHKRNMLKFIQTKS